MDAILEALDRESLKLLCRALRRPEALERLIWAKYLPRPELGAISLDSQEAQEAVAVEERRMQAAAWTWARLSTQECQTLRALTDKICGNGQGEELAEELDMRIPPALQNAAT